MTSILKNVFSILAVLLSACFAPSLEELKEIVKVALPDKEAEIYQTFSKPQRVYGHERTRGVEGDLVLLTIPCTVPKPDLQIQMALVFTTRGNVYNPINYSAHGIKVNVRFEVVKVKDMNGNKTTERSHLGVDMYYDLNLKPLDEEDADSVELTNNFSKKDLINLLKSLASDTVVQEIVEEFLEKKERYPAKPVRAYPVSDIEKRFIAHGGYNRIVYVYPQLLSDVINPPEKARDVVEIPLPNPPKAAFATRPLCAKKPEETSEACFYTQNNRCFTVRFPIENDYSVEIEVDPNKHDPLELFKHPEKPLSEVLNVSREEAYRKSASQKVACIFDEKTKDTKLFNLLISDDVLVITTMEQFFRILTLYKRNVEEMIYNNTNTGFPTAFESVQAYVNQGFVVFPKVALQAFEDTDMRDLLQFFKIKEVSGNDNERKLFLGNAASKLFKKLVPEQQDLTEAQISQIAQFPQKQSVTVSEADGKYFTHFGGGMYRGAKVMHAEFTSDNKSVSSFYIPELPGLTTETPHVISKILSEARNKSALDFFLYFSDLTDKNVFLDLKNLRNETNVDTADRHYVVASTGDLKLSFATENEARKLMGMTVADLLAKFPEIIKAAEYQFHNHPNKQGDIKYCLTRDSRDPEYTYDKKFEFQFAAFPNVPIKLKAEINVTMIKAETPKSPKKVCTNCAIQ